MKPLLDSYVPFFSRRSMAATAHGSSIYFFGGVGAAGTESIMDVSADLWCFDTATFLWRQISELPVWPSPRRCVGWISSGDNLVLWGGSGINDEQDGTLIYSFLNDEWIFDVRKKTWKLMKSTDDHRISPVNSGSPFPRYTPVFQRVGSDQFLFGGYTEDRLGKRKLNDTWVRLMRFGLSQFASATDQALIILDYATVLCLRQTLTQYMFVVGSRWRP